MWSRFHLPTTTYQVPTTSHGSAEALVGGVQVVMHMVPHVMTDVVTHVVTHVVTQLLRHLGRQVCRVNPHT